MFKKCPLAWCGARLESNGALSICCESDTDKRKLYSGERTLTSQNTSNTQQILQSDTHKQLREQMNLEKIPELCRDCYELINTEGNSGLDTYRSFLPHDREDKLLYLDVFTGNKCNLACRMCDPSFSKGLISLYDQIDFLKTPSYDSNHIPFENEKDFFRSILGELQFINFQGGEPLLAEKHKKILDLIIEMKRNKDITLIYVTNLSQLDSDILKLWSNFSNISITISIDGIEDTLEYIRYPLKWVNLYRNLKELYKFKLFHQGVKMQTQLVFQQYNALHSVDCFNFLINTNYFDSMPRAFYLTRPDFLSAHHAPQMMKKKITERFYAEASDKIIQHTNLESCIKSMNRLTFNKHSYKQFIEFTNQTDLIRGQKYSLWSYYDNPID
jgi:sulfatase maturation enzyme AslB (radical SAM superfamily)